MTIATIPASKLPEVPRAVRQLHGLDTHLFDVPLGATCWISCAEAMPHIDPSWPKMLFITLTVETGGQTFGDAETVRQAIDVFPGQGHIFIVDPMVPHWMFPDDPRAKRWVGLQWEVPRRTAKQHARRIVSELGAEWVDCADARYSGWAQCMKG